MVVDKFHILREIKRIADEEGMTPGWERFESVTGLKKSIWYPHMWMRWSEAQVEAGCSVNEFRRKISDDIAIQKYIELIRELKKFPIDAEIRRKEKKDKTFPNHSVFDRFGGKEKLIEAVVSYCHNKPGYEDMLVLYEEHKQSKSHRLEMGQTTKARVSTGFVYLVKSGRYFKIGRTKSMGRRVSELSIKIPVPPKTIHSIETDDPVGVEAYWHKRFKDKRGEGEWFELSQEDVIAFKRWKIIV